MKTRVDHGFDLDRYTNGPPSMYWESSTLINRRFASRSFKLTKNIRTSADKLKGEKTIDWDNVLLSRGSKV